MFRTSSCDAVSASTKVKKGDAPSLFKIPKSQCPDIWIRLPRHKWPKSWSSMDDTCPVILWQDYYGKGNLRKFYWNTVGEVLDCERLFVNRARRLLLSVYVDDIKLRGKTNNIEPTWKFLMKDVDLGEPTSFLGHVYLGCTQRECQISNDIVTNYRTMFESRISAGGVEKLPCSENLRISSWSYNMEGHDKKCVERYCELANKTTQQLCKVSTPCIDHHHFKEEDLKSVRELSKVCSQIVLKCQYLARIVRPDILWSMNKFARSIANWTKAEILLNNADWDCFKILTWREILKIQNPLRVEHCAFLEVIQLFQ